MVGFWHCNSESDKPVITDLCFELVQKNFECLICLGMTLRGWRDVKIIKNYCDFHLEDSKKNYCDLDLEDHKTIFFNDSLAHADASPY